MLVDKLQIQEEVANGCHTNSNRHVCPHVFPLLITDLAPRVNFEAKKSWRMLAETVHTLRICEVEDFFDALFFNTLNSQTNAQAANSEIAKQQCDVSKSNL